MYSYDKWVVVTSKEGEKFKGAREFWDKDEAKQVFDETEAHDGFKVELLRVECVEVIVEETK